MEAEKAGSKFFRVWVTFFALLLLRGDGYFPIPKSIDLSTFRILVLFQTVLLVISFGFIIRAIVRENNEAEDELKREVAKVNPPVFPLKIKGEKEGVIDFSGIGIKSWHLAGLIITSYSLIFGLHILQQRRFQDFGYSGNIIVLSVIFTASILVLAVLWNKTKFWALITSSMILKLYPLLYFPITAQRSDLLPIIQKAGESFLSGINIYQYYFLDNQVWTQMVRFPGLILSYLPAIFLHIDLRLVLLLCEVLFFYLVYRSWGKNSFFIPGLLLLTFFPYWHYRHELYETTFWVIFLLSFFAFSRKSLLLQVLSFSILLSFHQWGILFAPFFLLYLSRQRNILYSLKILMLSLPIAFAIIFFVCRGEWQAFLHHTLLYYGQVLRNFVESNSFHPNCLYFSPELGKILGYSGLNIVRIGAQGAVFLLALRIMKKSYQLFLFLACSLFVMLLTNTVAWTYQYLLVGVLLWLALMEKNRRDRSWIPHQVRNDINTVRENGW